MVKSILKRRSLSGESVASTCTTSSNDTDEFVKQKRVSFDDSEPTQVFEADQWDRSPAEITLRLTYKDVVELRELDVRLVRTSPPMMERTPSRRATRQRTLNMFVKQTESLTQDSTIREPTSTTRNLDEPAINSAARDAPQFPTTYQYQPLRPQSLPPLLEDASSPFDPPSERNNETPPSDSPLTFDSETHSHTPRDLPLLAPYPRGLPSLVLASSSPMTLSSPPRPPSPNSYQFAVALPGSPQQRISGVSRSLPFPLRSRRASVPEEAALEAIKGVSVPTSHTWKSPNMSSVHTSSSTASSDVAGAPQARRFNLMGWEPRKNGNPGGRRRFGIVRRGSTSS